MLSTGSKAHYDATRGGILCYNGAIISPGRRYTISLLVNYTGNPELRSFYCSMLYPNNACRKHLIRSFYQRKKKSSIQRHWFPAKDLPQL